MIKGLVLHWEESLDAFFLENLYHFLIFDEVAEFTFGMELSFLDFDGFRVDISE